MIGKHKHKNPIKNRWLEASHGRQKGKAKKHTTHRNQKKGEELVPFVVKSYLTHCPFNVTYMQIVKSNSNWRFRTSITYQHNLLLYGRSYNTLKSNFNMLLEKLNGKRQG
jgi:hypothetical protein